MTFISKSTNIIAALSIVLLFAFLLSTVTSNVVTAGSGDLLVHAVQEHDEQEKENHHDHDHDDHDHEDDHDDHDHDDHDDDEDEDEHEEFEEEEMIEMEMERMEAESEMMEMEMMQRIFEVTEDASRTSFFAIMLVDDAMEEEQAVELLQECMKETKSDKAKRAMRIKLVEIYAEMDNQDAVREHMKALILGK